MRHNIVSLRHLESHRKGNEINRNQVVSVKPSLIGRREEKKKRAMKVQKSQIFGLMMFPWSV